MKIINSNKNKKNIRQSFKLFVSLISLFFYSQLSFAAEGLPNHDIVVFDIIESKKGITVSNPVVIANSPGYDNQPYFAANGKDILYTRIADNNADIWKWRADTGEVSAVVSTKLSENQRESVSFENQSNQNT